MSAVTLGTGRLRARRAPLSTRWLAVALLLSGASAARGAALSVEDGPVVLGKTGPVPVLIEVDEKPGLEHLPLGLSVNVGRFSEPVRIGPGRFRAVYSPPPTRFPQLALVAVWRETGPDAPIDFLRLPLLGVTRVPVVARPGAKVRVRIGGETFGPVVADRRGRAEVAVHVPPGVNRADVILAERTGAGIVKHVPVEVPPYNRLTAAVVPREAAADGRTAVRLEVFYDLGGEEVAPERIRVTPSAGTATHRGGARGRHTFGYTPPAGAAGQTVTFTIAVAGDAAARTTAQLALSALPPPPPPAATAPARRPSRPARIVVTAPARPLRVGSGESALVEVRVLDERGEGVAGLYVDVTASGEPLPPAVSVGDGRYEVRVAAPATFPPDGVVLLEAVAHHPDAFAFGSARWQVEPASPPRAAPARPLAPAIVGATAPDAEPRDDEDDEPRQGRVSEATRPAAARPGPLAASRPSRAPGRLFAGPTGTYTRSPGVASGLRGGADLWIPFQLGVARLGVGAAVGVGTASRSVTDLTGAFRGSTQATFVPLALKLGYEPFGGTRLSLVVGAGSQAAWARFRNTLVSGSEQGIGLGWLGFADLGWVVGPGVAVLGVSYGSAMVSTADYGVDPGGLSLSAGYRVRVF